MLHTRKAISRMYTNKAQLIAMNAQLTEQLAMVRVAGTLGKSTEVMSMVNNLVKVRHRILDLSSSILQQHSSSRVCTAHLGIIKPTQLL